MDLTLSYLVICLVLMIDATVLSVNMMVTVSVDAVHL